MRSLVSCLCGADTLVLASLTGLQVGVALTQAPVDVAVAVRLVEQLVQHLSHRLPLVHHQGLGAAVAHHHLDDQLRAGSWLRLCPSCCTEAKLSERDSYLPHFGLSQLLQSHFDLVRFGLGFPLGAYERIV